MNYSIRNESNKPFVVERLRGTFRLRKAFRDEFAGEFLEFFIRESVRQLVQLTRRQGLTFHRVTVGEFDGEGLRRGSWIDR